MMYSVSWVEEVPEGFYVNPRNNESLVSEDFLRENVTRFQYVNMTGVNHLVIEFTAGSYFIRQASGYTWERGMFIDMY